MHPTWVCLVFFFAHFLKDWSTTTDQSPSSNSIRKKKKKVSTRKNFSRDNSILELQKEAFSSHCAYREIWCPRTEKELDLELSCCIGRKGLSRRVLQHFPLVKRNKLEKKKKKITRHFQSLSTVVSLECLPNSRREQRFSSIIFLQPLVRKTKSIKSANLKNSVTGAASSSSPQQHLSILFPPKKLGNLNKKALGSLHPPEKASSRAWRSSITRHKCIENGSLNYLFYTLFTDILQVFSTAIREDLICAGRSIIKLRTNITRLVKTTELEITRTYPSFFQFSPLLIPLCNEACYLPVLQQVAEQ